MKIVAVVTATRQAFDRFCRIDVRTQPVGEFVKFVHVASERDCQGVAFDDVRTTEPFVWPAYYRARMSLRKS